MIVKMKKNTFVGLNAEKDRFIHRLQDVGVTHITLPKESAEPTELIRELQKVSDVRKFLSRLGTAASPASDIASDPMAICTKRDELSQRESRLQGEISALMKERMTLMPWGDFDPEDIAMLRAKGLDIRFYRMSRKMFEAKPFARVFCHVTRKTEGEVLFVAISPEPISLGLAEEKLPAKSLLELNREILARQDELAWIQTEYVFLSEKVQALLGAETRLRDDCEYHKVLLNTDSFLEDRLFLLNCWSPLSEEELIKSIGPGFTFSHFSEDPQDGDRVPILLSNKATCDSGEDLVKIYSLPNYSDFDPSGVVLYAFSVFYGMIIGDAGYGLFFLLLSLFLHWKVKSDSPLWIRFRRLSYVLSGSVMFFGVISASYFGVHLADDNPLNKVMLLNFNIKEGQNQAMLFSVIVGMVHLSFAHAIKFYRTRDLTSVGWIIVIWSAYTLFDARMVQGVEAPIATYILIFGLSLIVVFTSRNKNIIIRILAGLNGALGIVQLFADVLSYIRLFALGLATMYMCQTFNMLSGMAYDSLPYVGFIMAALILVCGHAINIVLGIMGGVVHGLRLNFLEWYRWCLEGDGLPFKPFRKIAKQRL